MPIPRPHVVLVRCKAERENSFSWAFIVVEGGDESQFLLAAAGRKKVVMVTMKVWGVLQLLQPAFF